jgi:hypothetical protein
MDSNVHFPPSSCQLFHLRPKYGPWLPLLEHPQPIIQFIKQTFMQYAVYIKLHTNFHFNTF